MGKEPAKKIEHRNIPFSELVFMEDNPRRISESDFETLVESIRKDPAFFDNRPCLVNHTGGKYLVYAGFQRAHAAHLRLGWQEIPCSVEADVPEATMRERAIRDNTHQGTWDSDVLSGWEFEVPELRALGVPEFVFGEVDNSLNSEKLEAQEDNYAIPEEIKTDIVSGDLFEIGPHRLLCGDSTSADDVGRLLSEEKPFLMVTDPPYGVEYDANWRKDAGIKNCENNSTGIVTNDNNADWTETWALSPCSVAYVWHAGRYAKTVQESIEKCDFEIRNQIIWGKEQGVISRGHYNWQHEPCWYAVRKKSTARWCGDQKQTTLWQINKSNRKDTGHSTQKPVECMARPIKNHEGDVYDPFLGSGTTMVAAHQLNRRCYGMEIDPKYCQVIVDRMLKLDPTLEIKRNGQPYNKLKN